MASNSMSQQSANPLIARARSTRGTAAHARGPFESPSSNICLFLTNLRLLDLDRLSDWPDITALTFAAKDAGQGQKRRIQCVEWALYQLFVLWDAEEARQKLRPFFPPLDQLQSTNLRAALLRLLERLKKNGVLGRDVAIRKTMLDECSGDRLEEILAIFSSAVLKKQVSEQQLHSTHAATAQSLALEDRGFGNDRTELGVLILAHKASLRRKLDQRAVSRRQYMELEELLNTKQQELEERWQRLKATGTETYSANPSEEEKLRVHHVVRNNWSGNEQWQEAVLYGDSRSQRGGVLSTPFDRVWRRTRSSRLAELQGHRDGLVGQLDSRVRAQQERLAKWQKFCNAMFGKSPDTHRTKDTPTTMHHRKGISLSLNLHEALVTGSLGHQEMPGISRCHVRGEYADILCDIETELANSAQVPAPGIAALFSDHRQPTSPLRQATASVVSIHGLQTATEPSSGLSDLKMGSAEPSDSESLSKSCADDAKSIQSQWSSKRGPQPLQHIQLEESSSEMVSSAQARSSSQFHGAATSPQRRSHTIITSEDLQTPEPRLTRSPETLSKLPPPSTYEDAVTQSPDQVPQSPKQQQADEILAFMDEASSSPIKQPRQRHTLSLEERTRLSMGRFEREIQGEEGNIDFGSGRWPSRRPTISQKAVLSKTEGHARTLDDVTTQPMQTTTAGSTEDNDLVARTRRSMTNFESAQQKAKLERRRSERIAARQQSGSMARQSYFAPTAEDGGSAGEGSSAVVLEELMAKEQESAGADYESIFKSRPKIKSSPPSTPVHGAFEWN